MLQLVHVRRSAAYVRVQVIMPVLAIGGIVGNPSPTRARRPLLTLVTPTRVRQYRTQFLIRVWHSETSITFALAPLGIPGKNRQTRAQVLPRLLT